MYLEPADTYRSAAVHFDTSLISPNFSPPQKSLFLPCLCFQPSSRRHLLVAFTSSTDRHRRFSRLGRGQSGLISWTKSRAIIETAFPSRIHRRLYFQRHYGRSRSFQPFTILTSRSFHHHLLLCHIHNPHCLLPLLLFGGFSFPLFGRNNPISDRNWHRFEVGRADRIRLHDFSTTK